MKKPKLAILLEFGFHEIKKYIHSGFANELSKEFDLVWFALDKGSKEFHDYFISTGFPLVYFEEKDFNKQPNTIEKYNQIVRRNWIANKSLGGFHNHSKVRTKSFKTVFYGNSLSKFIFEKLTIQNVRKKYISKVMYEKIKERNIDILFLTGYNSCFSKSFAATGIKMNKEVHYLTNSWKDLFNNNFIPFTSFSTIFVWSEQMIKDFKYHMPYLKKSNFVISGNPTFDVLLNVKPNQEREFYTKKYGLPIDAKWLLYTMMPVGLVLDEIDTIIYTANEILKKHPKEIYSILVRKNPTHSVEDFNELSLPQNMSIADHYCSYDKEKDMIIQSVEGENEWIDLLQHSELNLSAPSTVTLEFLALNKGVINIEYNSKNEVDPRVLQFFEAGFYKPLFKNEETIRVKNSDSLITALDNSGSEKGNEKHPSYLKSKASNIIIESLIKSRKV